MMEYIRMNRLKINCSGVSGICRPASCNKSLNLETGESQGFESDHLVEVYMEPRSRVEQDSQCGFKALLTLHPQELELVSNAFCSFNVSL